MLVLLAATATATAASGYLASASSRANTTAAQQRLVLLTAALRSLATENANYASSLARTSRTARRAVPVKRGSCE
jgi:hypothetical protein